MFEHATRFQKRIAAGVAIAAAALAVSVGVLIFPRAPPRTVVMFTGPEGGTYFELGKRYREILARSGIDLKLVQTAGAVENLRRLADPAAGPGVAFAEGGTADEAAKRNPALVSLGTLYFEPLWFFHHGSSEVSSLVQLRGRRIAIGAEGSATRALALRVLALNRVDPGFAEFVALKPNEMVDQLLAGELAAAFISASWDSPAVQRLLTSDRVVLFTYPRADAYVALLPFLTKLTLPEGVADMAKNLPSHDVTLFAPKASLVVRSDLHSAIQYLLLQAATEIHSRPDIFQAAARFPAAEADDFPLGEDARQFYRSGPPWLQRYLPFWLAVFAGQALVLLVPLAGIVYPLLRGLPALYFWSARRRIYRLYGELKFIENEMALRSGSEATDQIHPRLLELENRVSGLRVPSMYGDMLYTLKMHIGLVRGRLDARAAEHAAERAKGRAGPR
jgi:TRAP transporter TAXI family solute receptor